MGPPVRGSSTVRTPLGWNSMLLPQNLTCGQTVASVPSHYLIQLDKLTQAQGVRANTLNTVYHTRNYIQFETVPTPSLLPCLHCKASFFFSFICLLSFSYYKNVQSKMTCLHPQHGSRDNFIIRGDRPSHHTVYVVVSFTIHPRITITEHNYVDNMYYHLQYGWNMCERDRRPECAPLMPRKLSPLKRLPLSR
jgi:hypothetical protein